MFEVTGKVTTTSLKLQALPEDEKTQCDKIIHQKYRSAVGKLLWMAQFRDDLKCPVKELSRSLINPQDQDIKNLIHLLKYVNQTRDFVFVMKPQSSSQESRGQVSGSDCQLFRFRLGKLSKVKEVNKCFTGFSVQCQSSVNKLNSSFNCSCISRKRMLRYDSSSGRVTCNQEFH